MPVIVREGGWRILIYLNDHAPPHVHVCRAGGVRIKVLLPVAGQQTRVAKTTNADPRQAFMASRLVSAHADVLIAAWERFHG